MLEDTTHPKFTVGQRWHYATRPQEPNSTLTILKIEKHKDVETIIHIAVSEVFIPSPDGSGPKDTVSHMPISAEALESSVTAIEEESVALPESVEGYEIWREAFEKGQGGIFTRSVSECVDYLEEALHKGKPPEE